MDILQMISSLFLLLNKWFLIRNKKALGWVYGIAGMTILSIYLYFLMILQQEANLWIAIVSNASTIPLMLYGYLMITAKIGSYLKFVLQKFDLAFKLTVIILTLIVCCLLLIEVITSNLVIIQFVFSVTSLVGTLLLAFNRQVTNVIGWILYIITHILVAYIMFKVDSLIVAIAQIISCFFALYGIKKELVKEKKNSLDQK